MRGLALALALCCAVAVAATGRNVQIKRKAGDVVRGTVVSELETGYLLKLESGGTLAVKFDEIADMTELTPGAPPPPPPAGRAPAQPAGPCAAGDVYLQLDPRNNETRYCIGKTEVTVASYAACVAAGKCNTDGVDCKNGNYGKTDKQNHPMNCVSWEQADTYCAWRNARLPTLDEYREIADSVIPGAYPWGDDDTPNHVCWSGDEVNRSGTCAVGSFPRGAGRGGVLDIVGNVWEWTSDEKRRDRIFAGGAWDDKSRKRIVRDSKNWASPSSQWDDLGFRCVRQLPPPQY
jgi:hypothetical protein